MSTTQYPLDEISDAINKAESAILDAVYLLGKHRLDSRQTDNQMQQLKIALAGVRWVYASVQRQ